MKSQYTYGGGLFSSLINAVTSQTAKEVAKEVGTNVAKKALTEVGTRGTNKVIDKILPPKKGEWV